MPPRKKQAVIPPGRSPDFDLDATIETMRLDYLQCRDFGHSWRPYTARWVAAERAYESTLRCSRCRTLRTRYIGQNGQQMGAHYNYAEGYTIQGMGRLAGHERDLIRLRSVMSVLVEDTAEEA